MNVLSQILAGFTGLGMISFGILEIFFHGDQRFHRFFLIRPENVHAVRMWAMNVGAYNITFGLGIAVGLWLVNFSGTPTSGSAIVIFCCSCHVFLGFWLWVTEKRLLVSAIGQALFPALPIVFYVLFH
jgi:putative membrane protein